MQVSLTCREALMFFSPGSSSNEERRSESRRKPRKPQGIPPELSNLSGVGLLRATSNFAGPLDISWQISLFSFESSGKGLTSENKACIITAIRIYIFIQSILGGMSMNIIRRIMPDPQFSGNRTVSAKTTRGSYCLLINYSNRRKELENMKTV